MSMKPSALALLAVFLVAAPALAAGDKPTTKAAAAKKAAADKAAADQAAADQAAADKAAADKAVADKAAADKAAADKVEEDKVAADKAAADKIAAEKAAVDPLDPWEDPSKTYRFIGVRYRDAVVPKFLLNLFANGGRNVNVPMVGPEFTSRRDHLEYDLSVMYADYSMSPFLFKGKDQPDSAYELVASSLKLAYVTLDILYEIPLERKVDEKGEVHTGRVALLIGGGVGVGAIFGNLYRSQAYPRDPSKINGSDPGQWTACKSATQAGDVAGFCGSPSNNHYWPTVNGKGFPTSGYSEPSWAHGGSKPLVFPWLAPQVSLRYKPIKQLQTRLDLGFSTSGFFFGLSASYGL